MAYTAEISRNRPGCFLFLVDQSRSMIQMIGGDGSSDRKMDAAADAVNKSIDELAQRCSQGSEIRDYFHIGIIGYGHAVEVGRPELEKGKLYWITDENEVQVQKSGEELLETGGMVTVQEKLLSLLPGTNIEQPLMSIDRVANAAVIETRIEMETDVHGRVTEVQKKRPVWIQPHSGLNTPMSQALKSAAQALDLWIRKYPSSFPPVVIHLTDGAATDGNPEPAAKKIMNLKTKDGHALMFNCHLSESKTKPVKYPEQEKKLPDHYAKQLYRMSSQMPEAFRAQAKAVDLDLPPKARCYVFNSDLESMVQFLNIGTRGPANLR